MVLGYVLVAVFGVAALIGFCVKVGEHRDARRRGLPPEPWTDMSPFTASLLSGRNVTAYTAPVRAVTPRGVQVGMGRCCQRGHQSPSQAVDHAEQVAQRIATTGR